MGLPFPPPGDLPDPGIEHAPTPGVHSDSTSIESVMPSSHLILCRPLLLLPPIPPSIRLFSNESTLCMRSPKDWSFSFSIIPSKEHSGLISFRLVGQIEASKHTQVGCLFVPYGGVLFSPPTNPGSQTLGKVDLEDIFSGVVSKELGPSLETQRHTHRREEST